MRSISALLVLLLAVPSFGAPVPYELKVTDRGKSPRTLYEYAPAPGSKESVSVRVEHDQKVAMGVMEREMIFPATTARADIAVDAAPAAGAVGANISLEEIGFEPRDGVPEGLLPMMLQSVAAFQPVVGRFEAEPSGRVSDFALDVSGSVPGGVYQSAARVTGALQALMAPLPEVPIGEGAQWVVVSEIPQDQLTITQTTTYTLSRVDAHRLALRVVIEQAVPPDAAVTDVTGEWQGTIHEFYGEGSGTIAVSLKQLSPLLSDLSIASRIVIDSELNGAQARSAMATVTRVKTEGTIVK